MSHSLLIRLPVVLGVTWRTVPRSVVAIAACASAPAVIVALRGGHDFSGALTAATLIAGSGAGYAADDPAAPTLASSPTTLATRRTLRGVLTAAVLVAAWAVAIVVAARTGSSSPEVGLFAAELCATAMVSAAVACRAPTDAPISAGAAASAIALIAILLIAALSNRWPVFPALGSAGHHHIRWWWVAALAVCAAAWWSRDPASRAPVDLVVLRPGKRGD
jgi:hypothetical protein